jgi:hypothetical protein
MPAKAKRRGAQVGRAEIGRSAGRAAGNAGDVPFEIEPAASDCAATGRAMDDLVAVRLTEISDLKAREASFRLLFDGNPIPTALCDLLAIGREGD